MLTSIHSPNKAGYQITTVLLSKDLDKNKNTVWSAAVGFCLTLDREECFSCLICFLLPYLPSCTATASI